MTYTENGPGLERRVLSLRSFDIRREFLRNAGRREFLEESPELFLLLFGVGREATLAHQRCLEHPLGVRG